VFQRLKDLATQTVIFGFGDVATSLVSLLLLPVFTRFLTPVEYGVIALLLTITALSNILFRWGLPAAFMRLYYESSEQETRKKLASSIFFILLVVNGGLLFVGVAAAPRLGVWLFQTHEYTGILRLVLLSTFIRGFHFIPLSVLRIQKRARQFAILTFSQSGAMLLLRLLLVAGAGLGVFGVVLADLVVTVAFTLWLAKWGAPLIRLRWSLTITREALQLGLPRVPHGVAQQIIALSDRYWLSIFTTLQDVGVYSIGATIGFSLKLFLTAFQTAWVPFLYDAMGKPDAKATYRAITTYVLGTLILLAVGLSAVATDLVRLVTTPPFYEASAVIPWIAIGVVFQGAFQLTSIGLTITKRPQYYPVATGAAAAASVTANVLLIPRFGVLGAAWANAFSYATLTIIAAAFSQRFYPISYEWSRLLRIVAAGGAAFFLATAFGMDSLPAVIGIAVKGVVVVITYSIVLYLTGFFRHTELRRLRLLRQRVLSFDDKAGPGPRTQR
jgi:O-antigen/teichoic acid export membrane protein